MYVTVTDGIFFGILLGALEMRADKTAIYFGANMGAAGYFSRLAVVFKQMPPPSFVVFMIFLYVLVASPLAYG